ncbi:CidA/LrgA family protein [Ancylomarina salipaludis]|uniref:CidA/LrgA family protein n=1 Tax=Ancylomarina salipaludis TaxID=2501299 RepID=A0A4Q1JKD1_9BACT|nr:CidA/LrgA family protein [Ancylomarina salipaludis]RXQ93025.1 CidA/LrgA family protein [Ancylomarina salipaludis]
MILIKQIAIFLGLWLLGELISYYGHLPLSGSIIGMLLLVIGMELKLIKTEDIKVVANFLLNNMAMFFIPAGVGIMCHYQILKQEWLSISGAIVISALLVLTVVGLIMKKRIR